MSAVASLKEELTACRSVGERIPQDLTISLLGEKQLFHSHNWVYTRSSIHVQLSSLQ